jgi:hypothetical protein
VQRYKTTSGRLVRVAIPAAFRARGASPGQGAAPSLSIVLDRTGGDRDRTCKPPKHPPERYLPGGLFARAPGPSGELVASCGSCRVQAGSSVFGWQRGGARSGTVPYGGGRTRRRRPKAGGALRSAPTTERFVCCAVRSVCAGGGRRALWLHAAAKAYVRTPPLAFLRPVSFATGPRG